MRDFISPPQMIIIRSFDINNPGTDAENLKGGVAGGTILKGVLKVGDFISIRPGLITKNQRTGQVQCREIESQIVALKADENHLMYAVPGGLIGVGMLVDPSLTRADNLVGQIIGHPGKMPEVLSEIEVNYYLLKRLLGVRAQAKKEATEGKAATTKVSGLKTEEKLMINVGSQSLEGNVVNVKKDTVRVAFTRPVCANIGDKIAMSRRVDLNFRLIGWGEIKKCFSQKDARTAR